MLGQDWLPSPLVERGHRRPVEIRTPPPPPRYPFLRVIKAFATYKWTNWRRRKDAGENDEVRAKRLRATFEGLGGLWIKIGQLLSLRTDAFPLVVCRELAQLQHSAIGFPFTDVLRILREDLGPEADTIFSSIDETPLAAASISQVHVATLAENGVKVAVKIRRPEAQAAFDRDLSIIRRLIGFVDMLRLLPHAHLKDALWELSQMVREELDFRFEAANTKRMRKGLRGHGIYVPKVFLAHCSRHVLVTEYIDGVLLSDYVKVLDENPDRLAAWCRENDIDPRKVGNRLFRSIMRQLLEDNLFHADIHPGNILLLRENRFAMIDFGTIGTCEKEFLANYKISLRAMAEKDFPRAADLTLRFAIDPPSLGAIKPLRIELVRWFREWESRSHLSGIGYHERSLGAAGTGSGQIMAKYKVQLSWEFMRISRTWGTLDASLNYLVPDANYIKLFEGYFKDVQRRRGGVLRMIRNAAGAAKGAVEKVDEIRTLVEPIIRRQAILGSAIGGTGERVLRALSVLFGFFKHALVLSMGVALILFLSIHHENWLPHGGHPALDDVTDDFDHLPYETWIIYFLFTMLAVFAVRRMISKLERRD